MRFKVGQKVVCVRPVSRLVKDKTYTITDIGEDPLAVNVGVQHIAPYTHFHSYRFRPLIEDWVEEVLEQALEPVLVERKGWAERHTLK